MLSKLKELIATNVGSAASHNDGLPDLTGCLPALLGNVQQFTRPTFLDLMQPRAICSVTGRAPTLAKRLLNLEGRSPQ